MKDDLSLIPNRFDRMELAGSLGDLGTLIPLGVALMMITGLSVTTVLLTTGLVYIACGLYYRLPIPVQPLKVVAAIAIAYPGKITLTVMAATGILFGVLMLLMAWTGLINRLAKLFSRPIIRGIQLGLGLILISKGISFILRPDLFIQLAKTPAYDLFTDSSLAGLPFNTWLGIAGGFLALLLLTNRRYPAALILVLSGFGIGLWAGAFKPGDLDFGPTSMRIYIPEARDFLNAFILLVIPQIPLTLGNAIIGTSDTCHTLFGDNATTQRSNYRAFATSMGLSNTIIGFLGGMPVCHGSGGLAAHYRFGARTGGSNLMIGGIFIVLALAGGKAGLALLAALPCAILGVLLLFAGLELALLIQDVTDKNDLFIVLLIAGIALATTNMGLAFLLGIPAKYLLDKMQIRL